MISHTKVKRGNIDILTKPNQTAYLTSIVSPIKSNQQQQLVALCSPLSRPREKPCKFRGRRMGTKPIQSPSINNNRKYRSVTPKEGTQSSRNQKHDERESRYPTSSSSPPEESKRKNHPFLRPENYPLPSISLALFTVSPSPSSRSSGRSRVYVENVETALRRV